MAFSAILGSLGVSIDPKFTRFDSAIRGAERRFGATARTLDRQSRTTAQVMQRQFVQMSKAMDRSTRAAVAQAQGNFRRLAVAADRRAAEATRNADRQLRGLSRAVQRQGRQAARAMDRQLAGMARAADRQGRQAARAMDRQMATMARAADRQARHAAVAADRQMRAMTRSVERQATASRKAMDRQFSSMAKAADRQFATMGRNMARQVATGARAVESRVGRMHGRVSGFFAAIGHNAALMLAGFGAIRTVKGVANLESAFADLRKVTGETFPVIRTEIENMAISMRGISTTELSQLATQGSKLGVADKDLAGFTRDLAMMKVAIDDIDAETLSTEVARVLNAFKRSPTEAGRFGSALNRLADTSAASAGEILDVTRRMAASARVMGMTETQTLSLATAMLEAGTGVEVSGTAMNQILGRMAGDLAGFARVAGIEAGRFRDIWRKDTFAAVKLLTQGLQRFDKESSIKALNSLGIDGERARMVLLALGATVDNLPRHLATANKEWREMGSIAREFEIRGQTLSGRFTQLGNILAVMGQRLNRALGPVIGPMLDALGAGFNRMGGWVEQNQARIKGWAETLAAAGGRVRAALAAAFGPLIQGGVAHLQSLFPGVRASFAGIVEAATTFGERVIGALGRVMGWFQKVRQAITAGALDLMGYTDATTLFGDAWAWVKTLWEGVLVRWKEAVSLLSDMLGWIDEQIAAWTKYESSVEAAGAAWNWLDGLVSGALSYIGAMTRNWTLIIEEATVRAMAWGRNVVEAVRWAGEAFSAFMGWLGSNWWTLLKDMAANMLQFVRNIWANLKKFGKAFYEFMKSGFRTSKFEPDFTGLTEGFRSTVEALPQIAEPVWADVQGEIDAIRARMLDAELARADAQPPKVQAPAGEKADGAAGEAAPGGDAGGGKAPPATEQEEGAGAGTEQFLTGGETQRREAQTVGLADFAKQLQTGALSGKDKEGEIAGNTAQMVRLMGRMAILQEQLLQRMQTGQRIMV